MGRADDLDLELEALGGRDDIALEVLLAVGRRLEV